MTASRREVAVVLGLLAACAAYFLVVFLPMASDVEIIGFGGRQSGQGFLVSEIWDGSPAQAAGLRTGDRITAQDGTPISAWHHLYRSNARSYVERRHRLRGAIIRYDLVRDGRAQTAELTPRQLTTAEFWRYFGIRTALILVFSGLAVFILASKTRERAAFLVCICFCFMILWLASDEPYWPAFFSPLIRSISFPLVYAVDLLELLSLQLVLATLIHITLVFPQPLPALSRHPRMLGPLYALPIAIPLLALLVPAGDLADQLMVSRPTRMWLNSVLLVIATWLMLSGYRRCRSPANRERARWIVGAMAVVAASHLSLWNLPILFLGQPVIDHYDWLLVPVALIPLAMTLSITNHELFGIRGIIRGRIRLLETRLQREQQLVTSRDQRIRKMTQEIEQLTAELRDYTLAERAQAGSAGETPVLARLEQRYPELSAIRRDSLVSVSPRWERVFEQVALAAQSQSPVMISGESGTGKTDVALAIHRLSDRRDHVYKAVSCAQFEHADPAFALGRLFGIGPGHGLPNVPREGRRGLLEECDGGTLFLDDVDRLPLNAQDLLLYPLEGKPFEPGIGSGPQRRASVKFLFATNRALDALVARGLFRADVLARLGARVEIPPLRERPEDLPPLIEHFTRQICNELGYEIGMISPKALNLLQRHRYGSGNARELMTELQQAIGKAMLENDPVLRAGYLSERLRATGDSQDITASPQPGPGTGPHRGAEDQAVTPELAALRRHDFVIRAAEDELKLSHKSRTLSNHLRGICLQTLCEQDWDLQRAAETVVACDDPRRIEKLKAKMRRYLDNIADNVSIGAADKLYNNLPAAYHSALEKAIARAGRPQPHR